MLATLFGLFGLIIGSFLNVLILRRGLCNLGGRSACMTCAARIAWYDNIPLFSWFILRGRCRACGSRISMQYPLVEALTGAVFALLGGADLSLPVLAVSLPASALLIAIAVYDVRHTIIPDAWVWTFNALALLTACVLPLPATSYTLSAILAGPVAALPLFALWLVSRGRWMGLGDAKLALGIGWLLGPVYGVAAIFGAFIFGAVVSLLILLPLPFYLRFLQIVRYYLLHRGVGVKSGTGFTMKSEVPFGPFLISSCFIIWFLLLYNIPLPL